MSPFMVWVLAGALLMVAEIFTPGFFLASVGLASVLTGIFSLFVKQSVPCWIFFVFANLMIFTFIRRLAVKMFYGKGEMKTNFYAIEGKKGFVEETVNGAAGGYVRIYGDSWRALAFNGGSIEKGKQVIVVSSDGNVLTVRPVAKGEE